MCVILNIVRVRLRDPSPEYRPPVNEGGFLCSDLHPARSWSYLWTWCSLSGLQLLPIFSEAGIPTPPSVEQGSDSKPGRRPLLLPLPSFPKFPLSSSRSSLYSCYFQRWPRLSVMATLFIIYAPWEADDKLSPPGSIIDHFSSIWNDKLSYSWTT